MHRRDRRIRSLSPTWPSRSTWLLVGPPFVLLAIAPRQRRDALPRRRSSACGSASFLSGITYRVEGGEHIQRDRAAVYAVNHASNVEPPILFDALHDLFPRLRILYKAELRKLPILVRAFDLAGFVPLERGNPRTEPAGDRRAPPRRSARATRS